MTSPLRPFRTCRRGGFSLIEVLIAMLILSIGSASLLALFAAAASTHRRSVDRTNAALAAERVMSEVRAAYVLGRTPEAVVEDAKKRLPAQIDGYGYEIAAVHPEGDAWTDRELVVRVTLKWGDESARTEVFHTVLLPRFRPGVEPWTD